MPSCAVITCRARSQVSNTFRGGISFHRFPNDPALRMQWIQITGREDWIPTKYSSICSKHFSESDYITKSKHRNLKAGAVPRSKVVCCYHCKGAANFVLPLFEVKRLNSEEENVEAHPASKTAEVPNENVSKVLCSKCRAEVEPTEPEPGPTIILEGRTKAVIAKVYHFLEKEYEQMKKMFGDIDLTPLLKFRQRTAEATGFSERFVAKILKEEKEWYSTQIEPPEKRRKVGEDKSNKMDSLHGSCEGVLGSSANDNCERAGNLNESEAGPVAEELMMEVAATNIIRLEHPEDDLETLIVKEEVSDDDEVNETDNIGVPSGAGFDAVEDTMNKEPYEVTLHDPTTACGDVIKTEPEDDGYPVPPERNEVSIAKAIIKIEPDDDKSSGEEKRKELKRNKTNARQRAYYQRQKDLKKNEEKKRKKKETVPKSNAERQRKFRQRNAEKSYMDMSSSVEHGTGVHIEKIDFTEEEFK